MTTERPACGLASLLSMSCRDRAEAFARSLQVRLQTLGLGHAGHAPDHAAPTVAPAAPSPSPPSPAATTKDRARPPLRLGSSSDSDLYYDFDLDPESPESPGSPAEDAVELVVARQPLPANSASVEPESGCTSSRFGTSPGSDSSDSFGPEAFVSPSSSPGWSAALTLAQRRRSPPALTCTCNGSATILNGDAHQDDHDEDEDSFTRLESGRRNNIPNGNAHLLESELNCIHNGFHSEESPLITKNNNNSQESNETKKYAKCLPTTNSSHSEDHDEVSKFCDEQNAINHGNRKCLDTESIAVNINAEDEIELLPESSKSDYGRAENEECGGMSFLNSDDWDDRFSDYIPGETLDGEEETAQVTNGHTTVPLPRQENKLCPSVCPESASLECPPETLNGDVSLNGEIQSARAEMGILPRRPSWESQGNDVRRKNTLIINQEDNLEDRAQIQESVTSCESSDKTQDVDEVVSSTSLLDPESVSVAKESYEDKTEISSVDKPKSKEEEEGEEEENDDDEESPKQRLRRCSSLKTGKTPPGTPSRKKIVRFADALGLDLADVRTFLDEIPKIPSSAYDDLQGADLSLGSLANPIVANSFSVVSGPDPEMAMSLSLMQPCKTLMPMFQQPGGQSDFLERIRTKYVSLENAVVKDPTMFSIGGVVRVRNLAFDKSVYVRYTIDNWTTYSDLQATYVPNSCDGFSDKFSFILFAHTLTVGQRIEFAVRFQCGGSIYWDSNGGANYGFQCLPACSPTPYMSLPSPDDHWSSFY